MICEDCGFPTDESVRIRIYTPDDPDGMHYRVCPECADRLQRGKRKFDCENCGHTWWSSNVTSIRCGNAPCPKCDIEPGDPEAADPPAG